jgi:hypothetical protein
MIRLYMAWYWQLRSPEDRSIYSLMETRAQLRARCANLIWAYGGQNLKILHNPWTYECSNVTY